MKVALCLSGQPRFYKTAYPYIKHYLIDEYNIEDIFCHFWWDPETNDQGQLASWNYSYYGGKTDFITEENILQELINLYNPTKIGYDKPKITTQVPIEKLDELKEYYCNNQHLTFQEYDPDYQEWAYNHLNSIIESQYKVLEYKLEYEKLNKRKYDWIVRARYDTGFENQFPSLKSIKEKIIQNPNNYYRDWTDLWMYTSKVHDKVVGGMWQDFDRLFGYINSPSFIDINPYKWVGLKASPEYLHWARLIELGLFPFYDNILNTQLFIVRN